MAEDTPESGEKITLDVISNLSDTIDQMKSLVESLRGLSVGLKDTAKQTDETSDAISNLAKLASGTQKEVYDLAKAFGFLGKTIEDTLVQQLEDAMAKHKAVLDKLEFGTRAIFDAMKHPLQTFQSLWVKGLSAMEDAAVAAMRPIAAAFLEARAAMGTWPAALMAAQTGMTMLTEAIAAGGTTALVLVGIIGTLAGVAFYKLGSAVVSASEKFSQFIQHMNNQAAIFGINISLLQELSQRMAMTGYNVDQGRHAMVQFSRAVEAAAANTGKQAELFHQLGVSVLDADGKVRPIRDLLVDVMDAMDGMGESTRKTLDQATLFGRFGAVAIPALRDMAAATKAGTKDWFEMSAQLRKTGEDVNKSFSQLSNAVQNLGHVFDGWITLVGKPFTTFFADTLTKAINEFLRYEPAITRMLGLIADGFQFAGHWVKILVANMIDVLPQITLAIKAFQLLHDLTRPADQPGTKSPAAGAQEQLTEEQKKAERESTAALRRTMAEQQAIVAEATRGRIAALHIRRDAELETLKEEQTAQLEHQRALVKIGQEGPETLAQMSDNFRRTELAKKQDFANQEEQITIQQQKQLAAIEIDGRAARLQSDLEMEKQGAERMLALHQIQQDEFARISMDIEERDFAIKQQQLEEKMRVLGVEAPERKQYEEQIERNREQHVLKMQQLGTTELRALEEQEDKTRSLLDGLANVWAETFGTPLERQLLSIVQQWQAMVKAFEDAGLVQYLDTVNTAFAQMFADAKGVIVDLNQVFKSGLSQIIQSGLTGQQNIGDIFKNIGRSLVSKLSDSFVEALAKKTNFDAAFRLNVQEDLPRIAGQGGAMIGEAVLTPIQAVLNLLSGGTGQAAPVSVSESGQISGIAPASAAFVGGGGISPSYAAAAAALGTSPADVVQRMSAGGTVFGGTGLASGASSPLAGLLQLASLATAVGGGGGAGGGGGFGMSRVLSLLSSGSSVAGGLGGVGGQAGAINAISGLLGFGSTGLATSVVPAAGAFSNVVAGGSSTAAASGGAGLAALAPAAAAAVVAITAAAVVQTALKEKRIGPYGQLGFSATRPLRPGEAEKDFFSGAGAVSIAIPFIAVIAAAVTAIVAAIKTALYNPPSGEGLIGRAVGEIVTKAGYPTSFLAGGGKDLGSGHEYTGSRDQYFPQVPLPASYAGIDRVPANLLYSSLVADAARVTSRISARDINEGPVVQMLNRAAALGLAAEDARQLIRASTKTVAGSFEQGVLQLRRFQMETAARPGVHGARFGEEDAQGRQFFAGGLEQLITSFYDLPPAVDAGRLALTALDKDGNLHLEALKRGIDNAVKAAQGLQLGATYRAGLEAGGPGGGAAVFSSTLFQNAFGSVADILTTAIEQAPEGPGKAFTTFTDLVQQAAEAARSGDLEKMNTLILQARDAYTEAQNAAVDYFYQIREQAPAVADLLLDIKAAAMAQAQSLQITQSALTAYFDTLIPKVKTALELRQAQTEQDIGVLDIRAINEKIGRAKVLGDEVAVAQLEMEKFAKQSELELKRLGEQAVSPKDAFMQALKASIRQAVIQTVVSAFIEAGILQGVIQPFIDKLKPLFKTIANPEASQADVAAAITGVSSAFNEMGAGLDIVEGRLGLVADALANSDLGRMLGMQPTGTGPGATTSTPDTTATRSPEAGGAPPNKQPRPRPVHGEGYGMVVNIDLTGATIMDQQTVDHLAHRVGNSIFNQSRLNHKVGH